MSVGQLPIAVFILTLTTGAALAKSPATPVGWRGVGEFFSIYAPAPLLQFTPDGK